MKPEISYGPVPYEQRIKSQSTTTFVACPEFSVYKKDAFIVIETPEATICFPKILATFVCDAIKKAEEAK